ncbi:SpoIIE family protein phosphatase, partial [Streptomyces sp. NPDC058618]|uniref:SpoIIE family protein phosphatase n=1 Tax=Streptomyces sp. NPDC058618 TaxID=3346558 RepID=UPI00364A77DF
AWGSPRAVCSRGATAARPAPPWSPPPGWPAPPRGAAPPRPATTCPSAPSTCWTRTAAGPGPSCRPETTTAIPDGSTLLLYTDGLVERRGEVVDVGIDRAAAALAGTLRRAPDAAADHVCTALLGNGHHEDDVALLVYRSGHRSAAR